ncbi:MAG: TraY domain-containing protein [Magnetococcales bacterium]|nr:TraY domain-containing protein [Magnetococcales bacterium]
MQHDDQPGRNNVTISFSDEMYQELLDAAYENDRELDQEIMARLEDSLEFYRHGLVFSGAVVKFMNNLRRANAIQSENQRSLDEVLILMEEMVPGLKEQIEQMMRKQQH